MKNLIIGYGEIGRAVGQVVGDHSWLDLRINPPDAKYNVMHVCMPYSDSFVQDVEAYRTRYEPDHIIIYSTVPIGTTKQIKGAVHSPVESRHPDLSDGIRNMMRWVGYNNKIEAEFFYLFFKKLHITTKLVDDSNYTEALKLLSTTEYGVNIVFADYKKRIADDIGMSYELTKEWNEDYNRLYQKLGLGNIYQKFVLDPPNGKIGGHCVRENSILLNQQYPDDWVKRIGDMK